jgi:signal transduction histidine kinase
MNQHLQNILNAIQQDKNLSEENKNAIIKSLKDANKELEITSFKLDRTEKVKRTTAILLEETIEELEQKRKAVEAQNHELAIESSLERVRTVALSMKALTDMPEVCRVIAVELDKLGVKEIRNVQTAIFYEHKGTYINYEYYAKHDKTIITETSYTNHKMHQAFASQMLKGKGEFFSTHISKDELPDWIAYQKTTNVFIDTYLETATSLNYYWYSLGPVALGISTYIQLTENDIELFKRFRNVFELAYRRFLDIEKAEAQTRESQIEVAVERVRAQSMAMHQTTDLDKVNKELFNQLQWLKVEGLSGVSIYFIDEEGEVKVWDLSSPGNTGDPNSYTFKFSSKKYPVLGELWQHYKKSGDYFTLDYPLEKLKAAIPEFRGIDDAIANAVEEAINSGSLTHQWNAFGKISNGVLGIDLMTPTSEDTKTIVLKMARAFNLAYKRFLDLQKAEEQAKEAQIETALERVRSRTLAMQKSEELAETAAVLFKQLILLGIEPNRLYISIMKDDKGETEFWITDEDGSKVSMAYEDNLNNNPSFKKMFDGWKQQKKSLVIDMKGEELDNYFNYLSSIHVPFKTGLAQKRRLQYIAYFSRGFIGMASPDEQPTDTLQLLERFAYVLNLTFTRFNDLQMAEAHAVQAEHDLIEIKAARKKAEETLVELQSTQKQLVQSEKMASLGELTAGIAHEIQNPLNFVNNFSEVSKELLDEMTAALESGDEDEARELVKDVILNLEKINHHGRRADAIVKGMLQHSRKSSEQKELTDINALCDEYIRLCYHGLRAKDKSFNANINTDFDTTIEKINVIPQDISRVLLNLFNNAFYAVKPPNPLKGEQYKPLVSVSTRRISSPSGDGGVEISVEDNGNGIPQKILDKIFQPFFTTKPTGQGTGLGLSLAYDIVQAHGGELKVESKEGKGSAFIIKLPYTNA